MSPCWQLIAYGCVLSTLLRMYNKTRTDRDYWPFYRLSIHAGIQFPSLALR